MVEMSRDGFGESRRCHYPRSPISIVLWGLSAVLFVTFLFLAIVLLVRSKVFDPSVETLTTDQTKLLWAFLGACLASLATVIGALAAEHGSQRTANALKETSDRENLLKQQTLTLQESANRSAEEAQHRKDILEREAGNRQMVDTVVKVVQIINDGQDYAHSARISAALMTLVALDQQGLALAIMDSAWEKGAIDASTATSIIDEVILRRNEKHCLAASYLLLRHAQDLPAPADGPLPGAFCWPDELGRIPPELSWNVKSAAIMAIVKLIISRDLSWWKHADISWAYTVLWSSFQDNTQDGTRDFAAMFLSRMLKCPAAPDDIDGKSLEQARAEVGDSDNRDWGDSLSIVQLLSQLDEWINTGVAVATMQLSRRGPQRSEDTRSE